MSDGEDTPVLAVLLRSSRSSSSSCSSSCSSCSSRSSLGVSSNICSIYSTVKVKAAALTSVSVVTEVFAVLAEVLA